jgi:hypothetical protein
MIEITDEDLKDWATTFAVHVARNVISEIVKNDILKRILATPEGRLLCTATMGDVKQDVMNIVSLSNDGFDKNSDAIKQSALRIKVAYNFMAGLATIIIKGEDAMNKVRS